MTDRPTVTVHPSLVGPVLTGDVTIIPTVEPELPERNVLARLQTPDGTEFGSAAVTKVTSHTAYEFVRERLEAAPSFSGYEELVQLISDLIDEEFTRPYDRTVEMTAVWVNGAQQPVEFRGLQQDAWQIAEDNGFHDGERSRPKVLALIHTEVSEALEADRDPETSDVEYAEELADIIIRVMDHAGEEDIDLQAYIEAKNQKNRTRDERHGKNY